MSIGGSSGDFESLAIVGSIPAPGAWVADIKIWQLHCPYKNLGKIYYVSY